MSYHRTTTIGKLRHITNQVSLAPVLYPVLRRRSGQFQPFAKNIFLFLRPVMLKESTHFTHDP